MQDSSLIKSTKKNILITYLRSVAVLLVLFYHLHFETFQFGYLGVDIFLVISGSVITLSILKRNDKKNFLKDFLIARIDRILPATIAAIILSFFLSYVFYEPQLFRTNAQSIFSSLIFLSNFYYYLTIDYFSFKTSYYQLIHFWSLSLEFQFYLIISFIYFFNFLIKNLNYFLFTLFILSFFSFSFLNINDQEFNFYFIGSRLWEFFIGVFLVLNIDKFKKFRNYHIYIFILAIVLIICSLISFLNISNYYRIIFITLGTGLIIMISLQKNYQFKINILTNFFLKVGTTSFSIYLVHQIIIATYNYISLNDLVLREKLLLFIFSIIIGFIFSHFFEKRNYFSLKILALIHVIILFVSIIVHFSDGFNFRFNSKALSALQNRNLFSKNYFCKQKNINEICEFNAGLKKKSIIWGDSHLNQIDESLIDILGKNNISTKEFFLPGCPPYEIRKKKCKKNNEYFNYVINNNEKKIIILHSHWNYYLNNSDSKYFDLELLKKFIISLSQKHNLILIGNIPTMNFDVPKGLFLSENNFLNINLNEKKLSEFLNETKMERNLFKFLDDKIYNFKYYEISDLFCNVRTNKCNYKVNNKILYRDEDHIYLSGTEINKKLLKDLDIIINSFSKEIK